MSLFSFTNWFIRAVSVGLLLLPSEYCNGHGQHGHGGMTFAEFEKGATRQQSTEIKFSFRPACGSRVVFFETCHQVPYANTLQKKRLNQIIRWQIWRNGWWTSRRTYYVELFMGIEHILDTASIWPDLCLSAVSSRFVPKVPPDCFPLILVGVWTKKWLARPPLGRVSTSNPTILQSLFCLASKGKGKRWWWQGLTLHFTPNVLTICLLIN
jgi:hypothetical protein